MDDTQKTIIIEFEGEPLEAVPFTPDQVSSLALANRGSNALQLRIIAALISKSIGEGAWETVAVGLASGSFTLQKIMDLLTDIAKASVDKPTEEVPDTFRSGE